jgi:outer membrane protein, heavy metal efflux system
MEAKTAMATTTSSRPGPSGRRSPPSTFRRVFKGSAGRTGPPGAQAVWLPVAVLLAFALGPPAWSNEDPAAPIDRDEDAEIAADAEAERRFIDDLGSTALKLDIPATPAYFAVPQGFGASDVVTLEQVLASVREAYPPLRAARQKIRIAEGELLATEGKFDLKLEANAGRNLVGFYDETGAGLSLKQPTQLWGTEFYGGYRYSGEKFPDYYAKDLTSSYGEFKLGVNVPLWRDGPIDERRAKIRQAMLAREAADALVRLKELESYRDAAVAYWKWVAAGLKLRVAEALVGYAESRDRQMRGRVREGATAQIDLVDNDRLILTRRERLIAAERLLQEAAIKLSLYLRDEAGVPDIAGQDRLPAGLAAPTDPTVAELDSGIDRALRIRPELPQLEKLRGQAEVDLEWAENQQGPNIALMLQATQDIGNVRTYGVNRTTQNETEVRAMLAFDMPVQRREARGKAMQAEGKLGAIEADLQFARETINAQVRDAWSELRATYRRVRLATDAFRAAFQLEVAERKRLELGQSTILFVNLRELQTAEAAEKVIDAEASWHAAAAHFRAVTGVLGPATAERTSETP